ncbi:uncharacterized protein LOC8032119 isoform X1 [Ixodes scapularis]|uniref:uncharacterized protein LOC8032119 isoform X1 n=2 Tax=Ixodes scapularis TaxID=6945 RepID=UPI001161C291|nr:uncharacterized protein LOC8032119 isoform X1 [Ixodes scapularis]
MNARKKKSKLRSLGYSAAASSLIHVRTHGPTDLLADAHAMSSIPYTMHSAVQLHRRLAEDQPKDVNVIFEPPTSTVETTLAKYNPKLMNSIWGLYNRYAPHSFQKNCEIAGCPVSGLADAREKSFGLSPWNRLH